MRGVRFDDPRRFFAAVRPIGEKREVENSLFLGVAKRLAETGGESFMIALESNAGLLTAALRTPPYALSICTGDRSTIEQLADAVVETGEPLPAVIGLEEAATWFADRFAQRLSLRQRTQLKMTLYTLAVVIPPVVRAPGALRVATESDRDWLVDWMVAFAEEAGLPEFERDRRHAAAAVDRGVAESRRFIWEDRGRPVAISSYADTGINGARVGGVRTAPDERGRGYASVMVASLSQRLLESG